MEKSYKGRRRKRPPRRLAGCGHIVYSWRDRERCDVCLEVDKAFVEAESWRDFRKRLEAKGLLS